MNAWTFRPCPWCGSTDVAVESEQIVDRVVTGVDEDNGPVYWAECQRCGARSPLVGWAADAIPKWNTRPVPVTAEVSVDDGMVERACAAWWAARIAKTKSSYPNHGALPGDVLEDMRGNMRAAITAALKAQKGVGSSREASLTDGLKNAVDVLQIFKPFVQHLPSCGRHVGAGCSCGLGDYLNATGKILGVTPPNESQT